MSLLALAVVSTPASARELRQPALKSQAALVVDQQSGEILLGKNMESKLPIASLTKLMTAIVTLDAELDPDELVTIGKADVDRLRGSHSRLQVGTTLTRDALRQHQQSHAQLPLGHRFVQDRLHRRGGAVSGHAGDARRAFDYHRAPGLLGQVHSCRRRDPHTSMAGIRLRPVQRTPDLRGLAAAGRLRIDPGTERLAGVDSGPRHEPPAFAPAPGTWGGPLLQLSSTGGETLGGCARRPRASPEEHSAEVFL